MDYRCRACDERVLTGAAICDCGHVFSSPVPEDTGEPGVVKWPPPAEPEGVHRHVASLKDGWNSLNDGVKAALAGTAGVLLIVIYLLVHHR
jgi:hypothetical protein